MQTYRIDHGLIVDYQILKYGDIKDGRLEPEVFILSLSSSKEPLWVDWFSCSLSPSYLIPVKLLWKDLKWTVHARS